MDYQPPSPSQPVYPPQQPPPSNQRVHEQVNLPAIFLIITGALGLLFALLEVAGASGAGDKTAVNMLRNMGDQYEQVTRMLEASQAQRGATAYIYPLLLLIDSALVMAGGIQMLRLRSFGLAAAGAIAAVIPCLGPCCCIGIPFGIWSLVVLFKPDVKSSFAS